jgi:hypothetical protein
MSPEMVFDHPGLCPPVMVATRQEHVRSKHLAMEFIYFVEMIMTIMTGSEGLRLNVGYKPLFSQDSTESIGQTSIYQISIEFC